MLDSESIQGAIQDMQAEIAAIPTMSLERPGIYAGMLACGAIASVLYIRNKTNNPIIDEAQPSPVAHLTAAYIDKAPDRSVATSTRSRLGATGSALFLGTLVLAGPTVEATSEVPNSTIMFVVDGSYSMQLTKGDMGVPKVSRTKVVNDTLNNLLSSSESPLASSIGIVSFADGARIDLAPTTDPNAIEKALGAAFPTPNGNDIATALDITQGLQTETETTYTTVILSDGTLPEESVKSWAEENPDSEVQVVVTGGDGTYYKVNSFSNPTDSSAKSSVFEPFGSDSIKTAATQKDLQSTLNEVITSAKYSKEERPMKLPTQLLWLTAGTAILLGYKDALNKAAINARKFRRDKSE